MHSSRTCPCCGQLVEAAPGYSIIGLHTRGTSIGDALPAFEAPRMLGNGNVVWPKGWTESDRRTWRIMMDMPGYEWPEGDNA